MAQSVQAQQTPPTYYEERVADTNPQRTEQVRELESYIQTLKQDKERLATLFKPDYTSPQAYTASTRHLRQAFERKIGRAHV